MWGSSGSGVRCKLPFQSSQLLGHLPRLEPLLRICTRGSLARSSKLLNILSHCLLIDAKHLYNSKTPTVGVTPHSQLSSSAQNQAISIGPKWIRALSISNLARAMWSLPKRKCSRNSTSLASVSCDIFNLWYRSFYDSRIC